MARIIFLLLIFVSFNNVSAQEIKVNGIINFTGKIGKYPVELQLNIPQDRDSIFGEYSYLNHKDQDAIMLIGKLSDDWIMLEERTYNTKLKKYEVTGHLKLQPPVHQFSLGRWSKSAKDLNANEKSILIDLLLKENLKEVNPYNFDYSITKKKANYENISEVASSYYSITSLTIDYGQNKVQKIIGFKEDDLVDKVPEIILEDMNFDGYLDLKLMINYPDKSKGDYSYIYYIYDLRQAKFIRNFILDNIGVAFFDASSQTVFKYDADGSGNEGSNTYKWQKDKLYLIKEERVYEGDFFVHYKEYKIVNGKSVEVKSYKKKE